MYIILGLLVLAVLFRLFLPQIRGWFGEKSVAAMLAILPKENYITINNVMLQTDRGTSQVDHVVVSIYGIFVIETKNYKGWITGSEYADQWVKNMYGKKYRFHNPIRQNFGHVKALAAATGQPESVFFPIVAFSPQATLFVKSQKPVVYIHRLPREIKKHTECLLSAEKMAELADLITSLNVDSKDNRKAHVSEIRANLADHSEKIKAGICPKCGGRLIRRNGKYGAFYGCSNYPTCKFTTPAESAQ